MYLLYARAEWIDTAVLRGDRLRLIALNLNRAGECFEQFFLVLFYDARDLREVRAAFFFIRFYVFLLRLSGALCREEQERVFLPRDFCHRPLAIHSFFGISYQA